MGLLGRLDTSLPLSSRTHFGRGCNGSSILYLELCFSFTTPLWMCGVALPRPLGGFLVRTLGGILGGLLDGVLVVRFWDLGATVPFCRIGSLLQSQLLSCVRRMKALLQSLVHMETVSS